MRNCVKTHLPCGQELERKWATEGVLLGCQGHAEIYLAWDFQSQFHQGSSQQAVCFLKHFNIYFHLV